jgi:tetratricopeptide (TPR) repeat protein
MISVLFIALIATFIAILIDLLGQLPRDSRREMRTWLITWFIKGAAIPLIVWTMFNSGLFENLPDFVSSRMLQKMSPVDTLQNMGVPISASIAANVAATVKREARLLLLFVGLLVIATYWMALTSGWLLAMLSAYAVDIRAVAKKVKWITIALAPVALLMFASYGWAAIGVAATLTMLPMLKAAAHVVGEPVIKIRPSYSKATAQLLRGNYENAEQEVLSQLEKCDDDFDGWMHLADLYANHFNDLPAAERMIEETCNQPTTTVSEIAVAYHRLADWYLKLENNPEAAIEALEKIGSRYPHTHVERMARLRIRKMAGDKQELSKPEQPRTIALPSLGRELDIVASTDVDDAVFEAKRCSELLTKNPNDIEAREKFARLLAEQLKQPELGIEQMQLLIDLAATNESAQTRLPEWLALMGTWQLKYRNDEPAAVAIFRRLIHEHPQTSQAFTAQRRLQMIEMEHQMRTHRSRDPVNMPSL